MRIKILIYLLLFANILFANDILKLSDDLTFVNNAKVNFCKIDKDGKYDPISIKNDENIPRMEKSNLGYISDQFWCKFEILNNSKTTKKYLLTNPRPGVDFIDVTVFKDNNITQKYFLGDMVSLENRSYKSVFSNIELELQPNQSAVIVSKYQTVGNLEVSWNIQDIKSFLEYENLNFMLIFIFFGFIFALMIYKIFIYIHVKDKIYLIYALLLFSLIASQASLQGTLHYFFYGIIDYTSITLASWLFTHMFLITLWIFTYQFFNIDKKSKYSLPLKIIIYYNIMVFLIYSYAYINIDVLKITPYILLTALLETVGLFIFSILMLIEKRPGAYLFFFGHFFYIISVIYYIALLDGNLEFSLFYLHITPLGLSVMILFMSIALSKRFQKLKEEVDKNKDYVTIGKTIAFVAHQWKQPISILSSQVMNISAKMDHSPNEPIVSLHKNIKDIDKSITFLNNILDSVKRIFLQDNIRKEIFIFQNFLKEIDDYFQDQFSQKNIKFSYMIQKEYQINTDRDLLFEVIKNIIQNSIDAFNASSFDNQIQITIEYNNNIINKIIIYDNAGGIKVRKNDDIFNASVSTKKGNMGIGLSMVKNILNEKLNSTITTKNLDNGTRFIIKIK